MWLLLYTNMKSYMGSPTAPLDLFIEHIYTGWVSYNKYSPLAPSLKIHSKIGKHDSTCINRYTRYRCMYLLKIWPWVTLKGHNNGHSECEDISHKVAELGHILLLNINRRPHMGNPMTPSHFTLSDLERSNSRSHRFKILVSHKEV